MKPQLPQEIEALFPLEIASMIYSYVPHLPKPKKESPQGPFRISPSFENDIKRIQNMGLKGKNDMYMRELEDFMLD